MTAWRVCRAVSSLNITALFDGVITAVCDLMWLFTALMTNEMLFLARVQTVPSIPTGQIIDPHLLFMTELISLRFWKRLQAFRAASLPSTYPKFLAQMSVISDGQAVDALSDVLLWASLLSFPTACWFYWDKKTHWYSTAAWSQQRCCFTAVKTGDRHLLYLFFVIACVVILTFSVDSHCCVEHL